MALRGSLGDEDAGADQGESQNDDGKRGARVSRTPIMEQTMATQVAKIALARKLLTVVWALLHHGECFDEERFARD
jgi:hypothetical protein